jgi:hypothetical protein
VILFGTPFTRPPRRSPGRDPLGMLSVYYFCKPRSSSAMIRVRKAAGEHDHSQGFARAKSSKRSGRHNA